MESVWAVGCDSRLHAATENSAVYTCNSLLCTLDTVTNEIKPRVVDADAPVFALAANDEARVIAYVLDCPDPVITVCSAEDQEPYVYLAREGEDALVASLAFDASGRLLYAIDAPPHRSLVLWNWQDESVLARVELDNPGHYTLRTNPSLWTQCLVYGEEYACVWEVEIVRDVSAINPRPLDLGVTARERQGSRFMRRTSLEASLNLTMVFEQETVLAIRDAQFVDETSVVCGCVDGELIECDFDMETTKVVITSSKYRHGAFDALLWDASEQILLAAGKDGTLRWFQWQDAEPVLVRTVSSNLTTATIARVGDRLAAGGAEHVSVLEDNDEDPTSASLVPLAKGQASEAIAVFTTIAAAADTTTDQPTPSDPSRERILTVTANEYAQQHTTGGRFLGATRLSVVGAATTAWACASCCPIVLTGTARGCLQAFRVEGDGTCSLVRKRVVHSQQVNFIGVDPTGTTAVSASRRHFVVLSLPDLAVRCAGDVQHDIIHATVTTRGGRPLVTVLLEHPDTFTRALSFVVPEDARTLADSFFSETLLKIDFTKAPITFCRLPQNVDKVLLTERALLCWDVRSGCFYACKSPPVATSYGGGGGTGGAESYSTRIDEADELPIVESFRGIFGRSSDGTVSIAGHFATAVSSSGQVITLPLASHSGMGTPLLACVSRPRVLATNTPVTRVTWTHDASKLVLASPSGSLAAMSFADDTSWKGKAAGVAKQAQQYIDVQLAEEAARAEEKLAQLEPIPLPTAAELQRKGSMLTPEAATRKTAVDEAVEQAQAQALEQATTGQDDLRAEINTLRQKLQALMDANAVSSEEERLESNAFVLDLQQKARLQASLEQAVQGRREAIQNEILKEQFLRSNIKKQCWDSMAVHGKRIYGFDIQLEVMNFPLRKLSEAEQNAFKRVVAIRRTEMAVSAALEKLDAPEPTTPLTPATPQGIDTTAGGGAAAADRDEAGDSADAGEGGKSAGTSLKGDGKQDAESGGGESGVEDAEKDVKPFMYHPLELQNAQRKRLQIVLLERYVRQLKTVFNETFEEFLELKKEDSAKIESKNKEIEKICKELKTKPKLYHPKQHVLENPQDLLTVRDEEITVERVLTAEERRQKEEDERLAAERRAAAAKDNARQRGIMDMMHGRLEARAEDDVWIDIPQPEFMTQLHKEEWTDEQKREAQAHEAAVEELMERRDKRRKALDGQLRTLHAQIKEIRTQFDDRLEELFRRRIEAEQRVSREELAVLKLAKSLQDEQDLVDEESEVMASLEDHRKQQAPRSGAVQGAHQIVAEINEEYMELQAADKHLEKSFRTRREFADLDSGIVDTLFRLFRRRPRRGTRGSLAAPLLSEADRPDGVDDAAWSRVLKLRDEKLESEKRVRAKAEELAEAQAFLSRRQEEEAQLIDSTERALVRLSELEQMRTELNVNMEVLITVQNGQVEIQHENDFDPMFDDALLVHRGLVEDLNATTRKLAEGKIEHMQQAIQLSQGVRLLEWEHKRLDLEREQLVQTTKEVQLFKVTKDSMSGRKDNAKEIEILERTKDHLVAKHTKAVEARKKKVAKLKRDLRKRQQENERLMREAESLAVDVGERAQVRKVQLSALGDGGAKERLRLAQLRHKVVTDVKQQASDLSLLQEEVDRQRLHTFPTFGGQQPASSSSVTRR